MPKCCHLGSCSESYLRLLSSPLRTGQRKRSSEVPQGTSLRVRESLPFVLSLVRLSGMALESASVDLRADHEVVMAAVSQTGEALQCTRIAQHPRVCASRTHAH